MRKAIHALSALALLTLSAVAGAAQVELVAHNQRSDTGTFSTLKWKTCSPTGATNPCYSTTNAWTLANATGSTAVWDWDAATGVLSMTSGTFQSTSFVSSNANGSPVISDKVVGLVIDTVNDTTTATTYQCVEGTFLEGVGAQGCANVLTGLDAVPNSTVIYNVGGVATCVQRTIGGDDEDNGNPRGVTNRTAGGGCDATDGAFTLWTVVSDDTANGGQLVISNGIPSTDPGTNYLTFDAVRDAVDDGPFDAPEGIPVDLDVLANDSGFADPVTVTISTPPGKGTAQVTGASPGPKSGITITYTANMAATGADSFVYTVSDAGGSDTATVTLNILAFGANDDTASTTRNHAAFDINVGANDAGFDDPVTITITVAPDQGGSAIPGAPGPRASAAVSYTPAITAPGTATYVETFTYEIDDGVNPPGTALVTVTVNNTVPVANDVPLTISTQGSAPGTIPGTFNAGTFAGNSLGNTPSVVTTTQGATGATGVTSVSIVTYTPAATFFKGTDEFDYTITDSDPDTPETDTGTVMVNIPDVDPVLADTSITTTEGTASVPKTLGITLGNGSQAQHVVAVSTQATNGSCALSGMGTTLTYTPNAGYTGGDSCVITITDEDGAGQSDTGTATITVNAPSSGGGGNGAELPGGSSAVDFWSLVFLASALWLRRRRMGFNDGEMRA